MEPKNDRPSLAVKSVKITFMVEASREGKTVNIQPVDVNVFEAQFGSTLETLVAALLEQANRSFESAAGGGGSKE